MSMKEGIENQQRVSKVCLVKEEQQASGQLFLPS